MYNNESTKGSKVELVDDLSKKLRSCRSAANRNDAIAFTLLLTGVVASAATTIAVGTGSLTAQINATLAAIPGIAATFLNTFKFEARARWWWKKHSKLQQMVSALQYEGASAKEVSQELNKFLIEHENDWPSFGKPPSGIIT